MILADENIDHSLINSIRSVGIEVLSIYESHRDLSDDEIIELSKSPPRIILTEDKDFGEWVFSHKVKNISVILLRYKYQETEDIRRIIVKTLSEKRADLIGKFTIISTVKIRIREI